EVIDTSGGLNVGINASVAPLRLRPVTWKFGMFVVPLPLKTDVGLTERMLGTGMSVKLMLEVAVWVPTVTEIGPLVAAAGIVTTRVVAVADITVAVTPFIFTAFDERLGLKPWPEIVTVPRGTPCCGVKLKIDSEPGTTL